MKNKEELNTFDKFIEKYLVKFDWNRSLETELFCTYIGDGSIIRIKKETDNYHCYVYPSYNKMRDNDNFKKNLIKALEKVNDPNYKYECKQWIENKDFKYYKAPFNENVVKFLWDGEKEEYLYDIKTKKII